MQGSRLLTAASTVALGVAGMSACQLLPGETFEDSTSLSRKVTSLRLENDSGRVTVRGRDGLKEVTVRREVEYHGDRPTGRTYGVRDGVMTLRGCGEDCAISYTVEVPAGVAVTGSTTNGRLDLSDVGRVRVSTHSGRVTLDGVSGTVDVRTSNGRIHGRGLRGEGITAQTSNGSIDLTPARAQDVRARTSNGAITLTVPSGDYRVSADTTHGDKDIGVRDDPSAEHRLALVTSNGDITVRSS